MIHDERIRVLRSGAGPAGDYVLYWMQAAQRSRWNHALEFAIRQAGGLNLPVVVVFGLDLEYPGANLRHYQFMLEGLAETRADLAARGIRMVVRSGSPLEAARALAARAALLVADRGYLPHQRQWRRQLAASVSCPLVEVETETVVPVETASGKDEYTAATLRPKLNRLLPRFLTGLEMHDPVRSSLEQDLPAGEGEALLPLLARLPPGRQLPPVPGSPGGRRTGLARLENFIRRQLDEYPEARNDPGRDGQSGLSPYLHFGQLAPLEVALAVQATGSPGSAVFLEELLVRRELAINFVYYNRAFQSLDGLPAWCRNALRSRSADRREHLYSAAELERALTHDPFWNAAQRQLVLGGCMHGYMRMYWGKKILEWSSDPAEAYRIALALNDRYELDGRDPNGYAGVAWCFGKHDRPWGTRPVFGSIRYMNAAGLNRKFNMETYLEKVRQLPGDFEACLP